MRLIPPKHIEDTLYTFFETNKTCVHVPGNSIDPAYLAAMWNIGKRHLEFLMFAKDPMLILEYDNWRFHDCEHRLCSIYDLHYKVDV